MKMRYRAFLLVCYSLFLHSGDKTTIKKTDSVPKPVFKLGIENRADAIWKKLKSSDIPINVGLVTNHTGKDQLGRRTIDILLARGINVKKIFVPEHGFDGLAHAEKTIYDSVEAKTNIPIMSLYAHGTGKKIHAKTFNDIDAIIFDIQDSGMRHYTYISTLFYVLEAAAIYNKQLIVLDRPNPLGALMEGPITDKESRSFIAVAQIPLRHALTVGELARYFNEHVIEQKASLHVVPMLEYKRTDGLRTVYTKLSPNLPTKASCYAYSMLGMLGEVRPCDVGLGTDHAMEVITLPKSKGISDLKWFELNKTLKSFGIHTKQTIYYSVRKKEYCHGLRLMFPQINKAFSFQGLLTILKYFHDSGVKLTFSKYFDVAIGTPKVQEYIKGEISYESLQHEINEQLYTFNKKAQAVLLYQPAPRII